MDMWFDWTSRLVVSMRCIIPASPMSKALVHWLLDFRNGPIMCRSCSASEAATQSPLRVSHVHKLHLILLLQNRLIRPTRFPRCSCHFSQSFPMFDRHKGKAIVLVLQSTSSVRRVHHGPG
jgi:hypothetical protein